MGAQARITGAARPGSVLPNPGGPRFAGHTGVLGPALAPDVFCRVLGRGQVQDTCNPAVDLQALGSRECHRPSAHLVSPSHVALPALRHLEARRHSEHPGADARLRVRPLHVQLQRALRWQADLGGCKGRAVIASPPGEHGHRFDRAVAFRKPTQVQTQGVDTSHGPAQHVCVVHRSLQLQAEGRLGEVPGQGQG